MSHDKEKQRLFYIWASGTIRWFSGMITWFYVQLSAPVFGLWERKVFSRIYFCVIDRQHHCTPTAPGQRLFYFYVQELNVKFLKKVPESLEGSCGGHKVLFCGFVPVEHLPSVLVVEPIRKQRVTLRGSSVFRGDGLDCSTVSNFLSSWNQQKAVFLPSTLIV